MTARATMVREVLGSITDAQGRVGGLPCECSGAGSCYRCRAWKHLASAADALIERCMQLNEDVGSVKVGGTDCD